MGRVIFAGLSIGMLFTLFVVPAMDTFIGADHHREARNAGAGLLSSSSGTRS
ncbi:hypothetical protein IHE31_13220 [Mycetohabitans rhizoxinica]|uniref:Acriflavin resistance plasma membrane protein n=1 Tax=Mycetohabitans rhizoxinica TaxID=412963 RepID=A0ABZ2PUN7_9BURK|nr:MULTISPECIES: hypothetical protein [Mycetohabitans]MCF7696477.1 hypothetical protein [Mycetohabitans sp. B2]MCG1047811.1 hypothetical protein [Mycetohabitans sp. B6]